MKKTLTAAQRRAALADLIVLLAAHARDLNRDAKDAETDPSDESTAAAAWARYNATALALTIARRARDGHDLRKTNLWQRLHPVKP